MILHRLAWQRIVNYFEWNTLIVENHNASSKSKNTYKTKLKTNEFLSISVSVIMSLISVLIWISIPFAVLESPCEIFKDEKLETIYGIITWLETYMPMVDRLMIALGIILAVLALDTVFDAIKNTNINLSPWIEKGKYMNPRHMNDKFKQKKKVEVIS